MYKYAKYIAFGIVGLIGGLFAWSFFKQSKLDSLDTSDAKISDEQASIYAKQLLTAMDKGGTDESVIEQIFSRLTVGDFKLVHTKFGIHKYFINSSLPFFGYPYDLVDWLKAELSLNKYPHIKRIIEDAGFTV